tara:strand:- start:839 stop:1462 length:624 start_codon:yes stop_codon:yes gene_type:complete
MINKNIIIGLYLLTVGIIAMLTTLYFLISAILITDIYFGIFFLILSYCIAKSVKLALSLSIKDKESEKSFIKLKFLSVFISIVLVTFSIIHIDGIYGIYAYDLEWNLIPVNDRYIAEAANFLTIGIFDSLNIGLIGPVDDGAFNVSNPLKYGWGWYYTDTELGFSLYANWFWLLLAIFFTYRFSYDAKLNLNIRDFVENVLGIRSED